MNPLPRSLARLGAIAVLLAPLLSLRAANEHLVKELKLTRYVEPEFPVMARQNGVADGQVALAISRSSTGVPIDVLVLNSTNPAMAEAAVAAAREWRFEPTDDPGELVTKMVRVGFRLHGVVVFPAGKSHHDQAVAESLATKLHEPVKIPALQELGTPPRALTQPMPVYPAQLAGARRPGEASVHFFVDETGRVRLARVLSATEPEFGAAALAAVSQWRYEPPHIGRRAVVASENWAFQFKATN